MPSTRPPDAAIKVGIVDAWLEYLEATRLAEPDRYVEVENWAWNRLGRRLDHLRELATTPASAK